MGYLMEALHQLSQTARLPTLPLAPHLHHLKTTMQLSQNGQGRRSIKCAGRMEIACASRLEGLQAVMMRRRRVVAIPLATEPVSARSRFNYYSNIFHSDVDREALAS